MRAKLRAFAIHLGCSALLAAAGALVVFAVWYPPPLHLAAGVTGIFLLLLGVDATLGPLMTLIVFKPGKPSLRFDITTIVVVQLAAFGYGMWTVAAGRPAWIVFNVDRFDLVRVNEIDDRNIADAAPEFRSPPLWGPRWVAAQKPVDPKQNLAIMLEAGIAKIDLAQRPQLYRELETAAKAIEGRARPLDDLLLYNSRESIERELARWPNARAWLPLMGKARALTVLLGEDRRTVVGVTDLQPWR